MLSLAGCEWVTEVPSIVTLFDNLGQGDFVLFSSPDGAFILWIPKGESLMITLKRVQERKKKLA